MVFVDPEYSTQECHFCGELGVDDDQLHCQNDECPVESVCSDRSAAVTLAKRGRDQA